MRLVRTLAAGSIASCLVCCTAKPPERPRRLYDLSPVSASNPVLARVEECGIEIPASELRGFVESTSPPGSEGKELGLTEKRRELQRLLDDHFWAAEGLAKKADQTEENAELLRITEADTMREVLLRQEVGPKARTDDDYQKLYQSLLQRIFDKTEIHLSPSAYELIKAAARRIDAGSASRGAHPLDGSAATDAILTPEERGVSFATSKLGAVRVGDLLQAYEQTPREARPHLERQEEMLRVLREIWSQELLLAEARERGLERAELVQQRVHSDRVSLARQWALEQTTRKATELMKQPGTAAKVKEWYAAHQKDLYTVQDENGRSRVLPFDADRQTIESDYSNDLVARLRADEMQRLRQGCRISIDEEALARSPLRWPAAASAPALSSSDVAWDADTRSYTARRGQTSAPFAFTLTNVSRSELLVREVRTPVEYVALKVPPLPWKLGPGERGEIRAEVDLRNKVGVGQVPIEVETSRGSKTLTLNITYPRR